MPIRLRRAPATLQHSFGLTVLLLCLVGLSLPSTDSSATAHHTKPVAVPPLVQPALNQARSVVDKTQESATRAANYERALRQACTLPPATLVWQAWGLSGTTAPLDLCQASAEARARQVAWLSALPSTDAGTATNQSLSFGQGAVVQENGTLTAWASGGANGLWRGTAAGWQQLSGEPNAAITVNPLAPQTIYAWRVGRGWERSADGGTTFSPLTQQPLEADAAERFAPPPLAFHPTEAAQLWTGGRALWHSLDNGEAWQTVSETVAGSEYNRVSALAVGLDWVLAGTREGWVQRFVREPNTQQFQAAHAALPRRGLVSALAFAPDAPQVVYAAYASLEGAPLWRSLDGGVTWQALAGLPELPINALVVDSTQTGRVFVGSAAGVFVTETAGETWARAWAGPQVTALSLVISPAGTAQLFAFANEPAGGRVWTTNLAHATPVLRSQGAEPPCVSQLLPRGLIVPPAGGRQTITVKTFSTCAWTVQLEPNTAGWVSLESSTNNQGDGQVTLNVLSNEAYTPRFGTVTIGGFRVGIAQQGALNTCQVVPLRPGETVTGQVNLDDCYLTFDGQQIYYADQYRFEGRAGEVITVMLQALTTGAGVSYSVIGPLGTTTPQSSLYFNQDGLATLPTTGSYLLQVVSSQPQQTVNYRLALQLFAAGCETLSATALDSRFDSAGGSGRLLISTARNCAWQAATSAAWLTLAQSSGSGSGEVRFSVAENPGTTPRTALLRLGSQQVVITQAGRYGNCAPLPLTPNEPISGELSPGDCARAPYTVPSDAYVFRGRAGDRVSAEITTPSPNYFTLALYDARGNELTHGTGSLTGISGLTFSLPWTLPEDGNYTLAVSNYQPGVYTLLVSLLPADCVYTVTPDTLTVPAAGGPATLRLQTGAQCPWTLSRVLYSDWLPLEAGLRGVGPSTFTLNVPANRETSLRGARLAWGNQLIQLLQTGAANACAPVSITPGQPLRGALSPGDCPAELQPLAGNEQFSSIIADRFRFNGTAGQVFSFTVTTPNNPPYYPATALQGARYGLLDPQGKLLAAGQTDPNLPGPSFILPSTGTYLFELASSAQSQYYDYELTIQLNAVACETFASLSGTRFPSTGGSGSLQIEAPAGCPWRVYVQSAPRQFRLLDRTEGSGRGQVNFTFDQNTVGRAEPVVLLVGQQRLFLAQAGKGGTCQTRPLPDDQFVNGELSQADCALGNDWSYSSSYTRPSHRYTFTGQAGEQIALSIPRATPMALMPNVNLYAPDGQLLTGGSGARALNGQFLLTQTGAYTVEVVAPLTMVTGSYQLLLERLSAGCLYTTNAGLQRFNSAGGTASFRLTTNGSCQWTPHVNALWVRLNQPPANAPLSGSADVSFTIEANPNPTARTATLVVGGQAIEIEQAGTSGSCVIPVLAANQSSEAALTQGDCRARVGTGVADFYEITTSTNERWRLQLSSPQSPQNFDFVLLDSSWRIVWQNNSSVGAGYWLTLPPGTYYLQVTNPTTQLPVEYTLTREAQLGTCSYVVTPSQSRLFGAGGAGTLTLLTAPGCPWTAAATTQYNSGNWLTLTPTSGSGAGVLTYQAAPYQLIGGTRQGWIDVADQRVTLTQTSGSSPEGCEPVPLAFGQTVSGMIGPADCTGQFIAQPENSRADQFVFTPGADQQFALEITGSGGLTLTLYDEARHVLTQVVSNRLPALPDSGSWQPFLAAPDNRTYYLELAYPNNSYAFNYTVRLVKPSGCAYTLTQNTPAQNQPLSASGGAGSFQVLTAPGCAWTVRSADAVSWLNFPGAVSGTGPGTVPFQFAANATDTYRLAGFSLQQAAAPLFIGQLGQGGTCQLRALSAGEIVRGTLQAGDCPNSAVSFNNQGPPHGSLTTPRQRFTFVATAGAQLAVLSRALSRNGNWAAFSLYDPRGQTVAANVPTLPYGYPYPAPTRLTLLQSGAYTLEYTGSLGAYEFVLDLTSGECGFVLESVEAQMSSAGGSGSATVRTQSNCRWTAYTTEPWLTLTQASGTGNGTLQFTAAPNDATTETRTRLGFIRLAGRSLPVVQAGYQGSCASVPISAGQSLAGEITPRDCLRLGPDRQFTNQVVDRYSFTAHAGEQALVKVISNGALGVQIVPLSALARSSATGLSDAPRQPVDWFGTASLAIPADGVYVVEVMPAPGNFPQLPYTVHLEVNAPGCGVALAESERQFGPAAAQASLGVTTAPGCRWQVYAVQDWLTVNGPRERTGADTVSYSLSPHAGAAARWGSLIVGGQILVIEQAGTGGTNASPGNCVMGEIAPGQTVYGNLSAADCRPRATNGDLLVADRYRFSGTAGERVQIVARLAEPRVTQATTGTSLLPTLTLFDVQGVVLAQFTGGSPLPAHARLPVTGDFFALPATGQYVIEVAWRNSYQFALPNDYSLSLVSAPPACTYTVEAGPLRFEASGGTGTVHVLTSDACSWTAQFTEPWTASAALRQTGTQTGSGTVNFTVAPNPTTQARRSLLLVGGRLCVIEQAGRAGQCNPRTITPGQVLNDRLDAQDCPGTPLPLQDRPNSFILTYAERLSFTAQADDRLLFTLTVTPSAEVQLRLLGPNGLQLLSSNTNRLPALNDRFVLPVSGAYEIEITSQQPLQYSALLLLNPNACQVGFSPRQLQFEAAGDTNSVTITTASGCAWRATASADWLNIEGASSGTGSWVLNLRARANLAATARTALISLGDQTIVVEQAGSGGHCTPPLLARNQIINGKWGAGNCPNLTSPADRARGLYQERYFLQATAGERLSLTLQTATIFPQLELYDEQGQLLAAVNGKRLPSGAGDLLLPSSGLYTVRLTATDPATYSLVASDTRSCTVTVAANPFITSGAGGTHELLVTTSQPGCAWSARSATYWLRLPGSPQVWQSSAELFSGTQPLALSLLPNVEAPRTGYLWIADQVIAIQQETRQLIPVAEPLICVNAATFASGALAPEMLVSAFGTRLANETRTANSWVYNLADTTVTVTDQTQTKRDAYVLFVSPTQVNFVVPTGLAPGPVTVAITSADGYVTSCTLPLAPVAPGLFSANASGSGWASGLLLRVKADGAQSYEPLTQFDVSLNRVTALPVTVDTPGETVYLLLFGTGLRGRSELGAVSAKAGTTPLPVTYCGPVQNLLGLDQVNLTLPATLAGSGSLPLELRINGQTANPLRIQVR